MYGALAFAVDDIVDGPRVASVEQAHVEEILSEEGFVSDFRDPVLAILSDDYYFREIGAVADEDSIVVLLHADAHESFFVVGVELGVVADDLCDRNCLEGSYFCLADKRFSVLSPEAAEPLDSVVGDVFDVILHLGHLGFDSADLFVKDLGVEL